MVILLLSLGMIETIELPLLHDNHTHVSLYAALSRCPSIAGLAPGDALAFLQKRPMDQLTLVTGWRTQELALDATARASLPPILLVNFSLHGYALTDAALELAGDRMPDICAHRDDKVWQETHMPRLFEVYTELAGEDEAAIGSFMQDLQGLGLGSADDMGVSSPGSARLLTSKPWRERVKLWATPEIFQKLDVPAQDAVLGLKFFLDGSIGARSAAIAETYKGEGEGGGDPILVYADEDLQERVQVTAKLGKGIAIHAIGERAIEQALRCLERETQNGAIFPLLRLEHVQFITRDMAFRARNLGAILSMQPNFNTDTSDYTDRLPLELLARNNPFRMLIDECGFAPGRDLLFGSDGMPHGLAFAASHSLFPQAPGQKLTLDELVAGYGVAKGISGTFKLCVDKERQRVSVE